MATSVYVNAFNLYCGCLKGTSCRWSDLVAQIKQIRYFTANVSTRPDNPPRVFRQSLPVRAWWVFEWCGQPVRG